MPARRNSCSVSAVKGDTADWALSSVPSRSKTTRVNGFHHGEGDLVIARRLSEMAMNLPAKTSMGRHREIVLKTVPNCRVNREPLYGVSLVVYARIKCGPGFHCRDLLGG